MRLRFRGSPTKGPKSVGFSACSSRTVPLLVLDSAERRKLLPAQSLLLITAGCLAHQPREMVLLARRAAMLHGGEESLRSSLGFAATVVERTVVGLHRLLSRGKRSKLAPILVRYELADKRCGRFCDL